MLYIVGTGPGSFDGMTVRAQNALEKSDLIIGFKTYVKLLSEYYPDKKYLSNGMRQERERVRTALYEAGTKTVSLICSGDPELYGMAGLAYEESINYPDTEIEVIPGVTAAMSGGALLGSPLTSDFAVISLSDILTPWEKIEKRLNCAAECDLVIVLYNPASKSRREHLKKACDIILTHRPPDTVCGYVRNIGREGEMISVTDLCKLKDIAADMFTTVFIGSSGTKVINGKMVTPRGYKNV